MIEVGCFFLSLAGVACWFVCVPFALLACCVPLVPILCTACVRVHIISLYKVYAYVCVSPCAEEIGHHTGYDLPPLLMGS